MEKRPYTIVNKKLFRCNSIEERFELCFWPKNLIIKLYGHIAELIKYIENSIKIAQMMTNVHQEIRKGLLINDEKITVQYYNVVEDYIFDKNIKICFNA